MLMAISNLPANSPDTVQLMAFDADGESQANRAFATDRLANNTTVSSVCNVR
jgi:hypothetical protein